MGQFPGTCDSLILFSSARVSLTQSGWNQCSRGMTPNSTVPFVTRRTRVLNSSVKGTWRFAFRYTYVLRARDEGRRRKRGIYLVEKRPGIGVIMIESLLDGHHAHNRARDVAVPAEHQQRRVRAVRQRVDWLGEADIDGFERCGEEAALVFEAWDGDPWPCGFFFIGQGKGEGGGPVGGGEEVESRLAFES